MEDNKQYKTGQQEGLEVRSVLSSRSSRSALISKANIAVARAQAKAKAAQTRVAYAQREIDIKVERARLDATLHAMEQEKEADAALAEAQVLEEAVLELQVTDHLEEVEFIPLQQTIRQRTSEYVLHNSDMNSNMQTERERTVRPKEYHQEDYSPRSHPPAPHRQEDYSPHSHSATQQREEDYSPHSRSATQHRREEDYSHRSHSATHHRHEEDYSPRSHSAPRHREEDYSPRTRSAAQHSRGNYFAHYNRSADLRSSITASVQHSTKDFSTASDLAKFLAKSQLVSSGLTKFDDLPEHYLAWKSTFLNTIADLDLSAAEELDLLIKWLGKTSSEHAQRIRSVNVSSPSVGLDIVWERLEEMYGSPEAIERALFSKIESFPKISNRDNLKLRELADLLLEVEVAKQNKSFPGLSYLDTARGVGPIVEKLPFHLQEKWMSVGSKYKQENYVSFPPFSFFLNFIEKEAKARNDPSFNLNFSSATQKKERPLTNPFMKTSVSVHNTNVSATDSPSRKETETPTEAPGRQCPLHNLPHPLKKCRTFRNMVLDDRKKFLRDHSICFRCISSTEHQAKNCNVSIQCDECKSERHLTALHPGPVTRTAARSSPTNASVSEHGGEDDQASDSEVASKCTQVCGVKVSGKSCSKICLVNVYPAGHPKEARRMYAILDDQSNKSLAKPEFFNMFNIKGESSPYTLKTCAGTMETYGRRAHGFVTESLDCKMSFSLPTLIECDEIPNNRAEIPTPEAAYHHNHLKAIANKIPPLDKRSEILLLLGRDILRAHKVREQLNGTDDAPYAQRLDLGWVIVGDVCLGNTHAPPTITSMKTCILENGRTTFLKPCESHIRVKDTLGLKDPYQLPLPQSTCATTASQSFGETVFQRTEHDNQLAPSIEDTIFLHMMEREFVKDNDNSLVAPLPFRHPRRRLPNNREYAHKRLMSLRRNLEKKPELKAHFIEFMQKTIDNKHAELAPPLEDGKECWYLPSFGVYHPQKPGQVRVVFDSSAQFDGVSLNDVLLSGPDLSNSLLGVLIRFRKEQVAVTVDIQQMFYCFVVEEKSRDYLRFLWYRDNDLSKEVTDYRMRVHVFGNSPSPAVAIYGLRRAAREGAKQWGSDVQDFIERHFYVDDALKSFPTEEEAVDVLKRAQEVLSHSNLRLHKIASNKAIVTESFPAEDRAKDLKDLDLAVDEVPVQHSLGVSWDIVSDTFTFHIPEKQKPFTRRGVLSTVNSLFDPIGFLAPVTIQGRMLLRELSFQDPEWDTPLPDDKYVNWKRWQDSLHELEKVHIRRTYSSFSISKSQKTELCVFSDASVKAIAAVAYLKTVDADGHKEVGFILGKAKLAPPELTVPRLELCAAVLAVEIAEFIVQEMDMKFDTISFYTDSKVVLGYIHNETRRFYVYVNNRVQRIRQSTQPEQWRYVPTEHNPADHGSRSVPAALLASTTWLTGPAFLGDKDESAPQDQTIINLVEPETDKEIRPKVAVFITQIPDSYLSSKRFQRFSTWKSLTRSISRLLHISQSFARKSDKGCCAGWHFCKKGISEPELRKAEQIIILSAQKDVYSEEFKCIAADRDLPASSPLRKLQPVIDEHGLLRIGGSITQSQLGRSETNPLIIPNQHHIATLLIRHYHEAVKHQGRHLTEGAIRSNGLWIVGAKRGICSVLHRCVICRKLRGKIEHQRMSDLPAERLQMDPPFSYVGLDVFGPWEVTSRRTRGGQANCKRWAVLFTCMCTRAIHIELIESMTTSSLINALRRFFSIRGPAKQLRSDCGSNFVGANRELKLLPPGPAGLTVEDYLLDQKCTWVFNPPHSSHFGGVWERMIGVTRRILDGMFLQLGKSQLTHEVLCTFMAEVVAIVNARPLVPVSSDPGAPLILTPAMLLTQKVGTPPNPAAEFPKGEIFKHQWKRVQTLAETFWARWRKEYLHNLQSRQKWLTKRANLAEGDVVLMKDSQVARNDWPMAVIVKTIPSKDGLVRKVELKVTRQGSAKTFTRPITELVLLLSQENQHK